MKNRVFFQDMLQFINALLTGEGKIEAGNLSEIGNELIRFWAMEVKCIYIEFFWRYSISVILK